MKHRFLKWLGAIDHATLEQQVLGEGARHDFLVERITTQEQRISALETALADTETNMSKQLAEIQETAHVPKPRSTGRNFRMMADAASRGAKIVR